MSILTCQSCKATQSILRKQSAARPPNASGGAVVIEDTSLCFSALNGLPGPYIKWFVDDLGNDGLYKLLAGHEDHSAYCQCALAFSAGPGTEPLVFVGRTDGEIVAPIGEGGFGWDAIFLPEDSDVHFAEMSMEEKNKISHRARAFKQFVAHCKENEDQMIEAIIEAAEALINSFAYNKQQQQQVQVASNNKQASSIQQNPKPKTNERRPERPSP